MCDFLPDSVHTVLNNVESSLSLPMLVIIVLCTLQFVFYHSVHIFCVLNEIYRKKAACKPKPKKKPCPKKVGPSLLTRLQKSLCAWVGVDGKCGPPKPKKSKPCCKRAAIVTPSKSEDEEEFDDEDFENDL